MTKTKLDLLIQESDFNHVIQPIIDLSNGHVVGYEVLLRSREFQNPELLFSYAREQDQLYELDIQSIFKAVDTFTQEKSNWDELFLFINIFPSTLMNPAFYSSLQKLKSVMNIKPSSIVFEINEAEKVEDLTSLKEIIAELKMEGFLIALDDVGTGESSLEFILELEPNIAKLDRYFANNLTHSLKKQKVVKLMLELFSQDATVVLEGFECEADLQMAKALGVPFGQGFYLGKPQPKEFYLPV